MFVATSLEQLPSRDEILSMSGLDFMQAVLDGQISAPPIGKLMNYHLDSVEEGRVVFLPLPMEPEL